MSYTRPSTPPRWAGLSAAALLAAALSATPASARAVEGLPYISDVHVEGFTPCDTCPPQVCHDRPVVVTISGYVPDGCTTFRGFARRPTRGLSTVLVADFVVDSCARGCPDVMTAFSAKVEFPPGWVGPAPSGPVLPPAFWIESIVRSCPDTNVVARSGARSFRYDVVQGCPPPVDSLLRSFLAFKVLPVNRCAGDSLTLVLAKNGCPPCLRFESFVVDSATGFTATMNWRPGCLELACLPETLSVPLGAYMAGHYQVNVNVVVHVIDTAFPDSTIAFLVEVPFEVPGVCVEPVPCVRPFLVAGDGAPRECALVVASGAEGALTLFASGDVPLGGLQGRLEVPEPFRITGVFPPLTYPGLSVSWAPEGRGARYVVFTTGGPAIPPGVSPVMTVAIAADSAVGDTTLTLATRVELASDPQGHAVRLCSIANVRLAGIPICVRGQSEACDANGDHHSDVRDLVLMSACLRIDPFPGGTSELCRDCDGDGSWAFADLLCCAQKILRLPIPPRDSVSASGPSVMLEEVERKPTGTLFRVRVSGADLLGAAMLRVRYPAERWRADVVFAAEGGGAPQSQGWLPLVDPELPGVVQLGGLRISPTASPSLEFALFIHSISSPQAGDELVVVGADLAGNDGVAFTVPSLPRQPLDTSPPPVPMTRIELGPARPNPFSRQTSFTVSLPAAAHVELTVHDLFGRRVATLLAEDLPAGRRHAAWDASRARDGIYFARLVVNGKVFTQRVALLRDRR